MTEPFCPVPIDNAGPRLGANQYCLSCGRPSPCPRCSLLVQWGDGTVRVEAGPLEPGQAGDAGRLLVTAGRQTCL